MKRMCAVLAVAGALSGIAPVTAMAAGTGSAKSCAGGIGVPFTGLMIPLC
jgi:hypothetical protein